MGTGGKRPNAGRKKGGKNRFNKALAEAVAQSPDGSPLEFLLELMRDEKMPIELRLDAAGKALPYLHRKQPQDVKVDATVHAPPPALFIYGPPPEIPDDADPDPGSQPN